MITEDYVSFETAELLKEKGFDESVNRFYEVHNGKPSLVRSEYCRNAFTTSYATPTHQMVLKWLREVYKLHITIKPYITTEGIMYVFEIYKLESDRFTLLKSKAGFEKSEEAVDAAIEYSLENLI